MHLQRLSLLFIASSSRKRYWNWTLPWIKAQIELSSTFVYDYKMSTGSSSARNSQVARGGGGGGWPTMKPMPANRSFYCRAKYNNQESYYRAIEGRSHDNFQSCIFIHGWYFLRCYFGLSHNSIHRHEHHCRSFPLEKVRIDLAELPP